MGGKEKLLRFCFRKQTLLGAPSAFVFEGHVIPAVHGLNSIFI